MLRRTSLAHALAGFCAGALLMGCKVGPEYAPPGIAMPQGYGEAMPAVATTLPSVARVGQPTWLAWWTQFNDPELNSLIDRSLQANYVLAVARSRVVEARAAERAARAELYPSVDISAAFAKTRGSSGFGAPYGLPDTDSNLYQLGFDASYEVDLFGGIRRSIEAAHASADAVEDENRAVRLSLISEVARDYIGLRSLQRRIKVVQANIDDQDRTLDVVQRQFKNGLATRFDVVRATAQTLLTESSLPPLEAGVRQSVHALSVLLGEQPMDLSDELAADAPIPQVPPEVPVGIPSELLRRRPDVMQAERVLAAATAAQGVATSDLFPHLVLGGTAGVESRHIQQLFDQHRHSSGFYLAGPSADLNLFDGGRRWANIDRSKAGVAEALDAYHETVLDALAETEDALTNYSHDQERRETLLQLVAQAQEAVHIAGSKYSQGLLNLLDVIDVQRSLYASQDALALGDQAVSTDLVALYKALGGGWEISEPTPQNQPQNRPLNIPLNKPLVAAK